jgi:UDP-galactose transporter B1
MGKGGPSAPPRSRLATAVLLAVSVGGIYASYLTQGVVNEHLQLKRYGATGERFRDLEALNGAQALTCFVWAWLILQGLLLTGRIKREGAAPWTAYWRPGITNCLGPACGMYALKNITYSAQVLAKSCKMVPVMLMGALLYKRHYSFVEYLCMLLIGVGVGAFAQKGSSKVAARLAAPNNMLGYSLCFVNLAFDGYTNAVQVRRRCAASCVMRRPLGWSSSSRRQSPCLQLNWGPSVQLWPSGSASQRARTRTLCVPAAG